MAGKSPKLSAFTLLCLLYSLPALAGTQPWTSLNAKQQEALAPISREWDALPENQQKRLLATTKKFHDLSPEKKQRYQKNLIEWSKLSQEQRNRAREKYKAYKKIPAEKREEIKRMVLQNEAEKAVPYATDYKDETPTANDEQK